MHVCMPAAAECFPAVVVWGGGCCSVDSSCFETKAVWQCVSGPGAVVVAILVQGGVLASKLLRRQTGSVMDSPSRQAGFSADATLEMMMSLGQDPLDVVDDQPQVNEQSSAQRVYSKADCGNTLGDVSLLARGLLSQTASSVLGQAKQQAQQVQQPQPQHMKQQASEESESAFHNNMPPKKARKSIPAPKAKPIPAPSSIGAPGFPDMSLEELKQRSCNITLQNSFVQGWELHKSALDPEYVAKHRHFVSADVLALIPVHWRALIQDAAGIADGDGLWVLRDIDLLDQFAGKARASKWALLAGLRPVGFDKAYGEHMVWEFKSDNGITWAQERKRESDREYHPSLERWL